jgi:hypothetical protein
MTTMHAHSERFAAAVAGVIVWMVFGITRLQAQNVPGDVSAPVSDKDCKKAAHIVEKGKPDKKEESAFATILRCPHDVGPSGASAIRAMRTEVDTAALAAVFVPLSSVVDASLLSAYLDVAQDATAAGPARAFAALALLQTATVGTVGVEYQELTNNGSDCRSVGMPSLRASLATPLPPGYLLTIRNALSAVASSGSAAAIVRSAAACSLAHLPG